MATVSKVGSAGPSGGGERPASSGLSVVGWLFLTAAIVPMAMVAHREGMAALWTAAVMIATGVALLGLARLRRRRH